MPELRLSFETFPPKHEDGHGKYLEMLALFQTYNPMFQSMTYGAGASDRGRSENLVNKGVSKIGGQYFVPHLAGAGQTEQRLKKLVSEWWSQGIRKIVALRGDAAGEGDVKCAIDLVEIIKTVADFDVAVAGYPEKHPLSPSVNDELDHLKAKVDAGANQVITQFFFDADVFLRYRDACAAKGIKADIVPGILPIGSLDQVSRFAGQCGATIPNDVRERFLGLENRPEAHAAVAVTTVVELIDRLHREGVEDFHLYTLNRISSTLAICHSLGIYPDYKLAA